MDISGIMLYRKVMIMKKVILKIDGMSCSACQNAIEKYLNKQDGVTASVNLVMAQALINYDENKVTLSDLDRFIAESGYKSLGVFDEKMENKKDNSKYYLIGLGVFVIILMYVSMGHMIGLPIVSFLHMMQHPVNYGICLLILTIPFLIYGFDIIKSGIVKLLHASPNMDTLVSIGVLASLIYSVINLVLIILGNNDMLVEHLYFESVAMIIYFIKLGRFIDQKSKDKTKEAIKELVQITPKKALLKTANGEKEVTIDEISVGDTLICKPGMKVAVDGEITLGFAHFDESFITGESIPAKKSIGEKVVAGSINIDGAIEYKAEGIGPNSTISEIVRLVVEATNTKAPISRLADKVSGYFVPLIMIIALLTFAGYLIMGNNFNESIISFVTVLVVACPCALGLATPLAIVVSEGRCAKKGILIKSSEVLEEAKKIDTIIFDKTGTLTYGDLRISEINNFSTYSDEKLLDIVSSLENNSSHPIAKAFPKGNISISQFEVIPGIGLSGVIENKKYYLGNNKIVENLRIDNVFQNKENELADSGNSIIYVIEDTKIISIIGVCDIVRDDAVDTISKLKKMGKHVVMLSGDNDGVVTTVGKYLGIDDYVANMMPSWKKEYLADLISQGHKVMMVGDGINDAPSLALASVGVSVNSGTDIAADSSDVILMNDDISKIVNLLSISSKTIKIIKENLFWAFIYNILMVPIAIGLLKPIGLSISPMFASVSMTLSSLTVVFNSLRLRREKKQ